VNQHQHVAYFFTLLKTFTCTAYKPSRSLTNELRKLVCHNNVTLARQLLAYVTTTNKLLRNSTSLKIICGN